MRDDLRESIFNYIISICEIMKKEASVLMELLDDPDDSENISRKISSFEAEADSVFHDIVFLYQNSNLVRDPEAATLLDVANSVERCTDMIDQLALDFYRYNITEIRDDYYAPMINISRAVNQTTNLIFSLKNQDKVQSPMQFIIDLDDFKVEAEKMYNDNVRKLFVTETDPVEIIRWSKMYDSIRSTFHAFEKVADMSARMILYNDN